ncbi:putative permease [Thioflavicoccus mobilis 8321]|uniref:Putative permease n=1 Tax=Thioflavicoccus mobilis 8321 TaxID=765912 RepID=L0GZN5_9GAMM|nr:AEC family transporter [Thioflavicoccus mobilis]AGA90840.1 putative permease [Thioflavicoccus mobilis 8321]
MNQFLVTLNFALSVTGPIVLVLVIGVFLARLGLLTGAFIDAGTRLVFNVTLPCLLFVTISQTRFEQTANLTLIAVGVFGTLALFLVAEAVAARLVDPPVDRGVVVQGIYRGNMAIIGLAYCVNAYGDVAIAAASLYIGLLSILYNVLAVITLSRSLDRRGSLRAVVTGIVMNPLIIGILTALPFAYFEVSLPDLLVQTGEYFAQMTLPLALLCIGGSLSLATLRLDSHNALIATLGKVLFAPTAMTCIALLAGLRGMELGILFMMSAAPTAASSYVMSRAMGGNGPLSANIVVLTTIGSVLFTSLGITLLHLGELM